MSNARRLRDSAKAIRLIAEDITRVAQELAGSFGRLAAPAEQLVGPLPPKPSPALQPHAVPNPEPRPTTLPPCRPNPGRPPPILGIRLNLVLPVCTRPQRPTPWLAKS